MARGGETLEARRWKLGLGYMAPMAGGIFPATKAATKPIRMDWFARFQERKHEAAFFVNIPLKAGTCV